MFQGNNLSASPEDLKLALNTPRIQCQKMLHKKYCCGDMTPPIVYLSIRRKSKVSFTPHLL